MNDKFEVGSLRLSMERFYRGGDGAVDILHASTSSTTSLSNSGLTATPIPSQLGSCVEISDGYKSCEEELSWSTKISRRNSSYDRNGKRVAVGDRSKKIRRHKSSVDQSGLKERVRKVRSDESKAR